MTRKKKNIAIVTSGYWSAFADALSGSFSSMIELYSNSPTAIQIIVDIRRYL